MTLLQAFEAQSTNLFCKRQTNRAIFYLFHPTFLRCQDLATRFDLPLLADGGSLGCLCDALCRKKGEKDCNLTASCCCRMRAYCLFVDEAFLPFPDGLLWLLSDQVLIFLGLMFVKLPRAYALLCSDCFIVCCRQTIVCSHQTIVCCRQTIVCSHQTKKTLSGARQLFVFRRKRSDVRHTISLSRRPRFFTPLIDLRHRERQKGGGGVKGLHSSLHWQADYNNE